MGVLWGVVAVLAVYIGITAIGMVSNNVPAERWAVPLAVATVVVLFFVAYRAGGGWMVLVSDVVLAFLLLFALWTARFSPRLSRRSPQALAARLSEYTGSTHAEYLLLVVQGGVLCVLPGERRLGGPFRYELSDSGCPYCFIEGQVRTLADGYGTLRYRSLLASGRTVEMHFARSHDRWLVDPRTPSWQPRWERRFVAPACAQHAALMGRA
jgi:hypothetical protein